MIFKEHACSTPCLDTSISDPLLFNNSAATSTPTKQKESISISCKFKSLCKYYYLLPTLLVLYNMIYFYCCKNVYTLLEHT